MEVVRVDTAAVHRAGVPTPGRRAFRILHFAFTVVPFLAGIDKFTNMLAHWNEYLSPQLARVIPLSVPALMRVVGVVEMAAAVLVALRPRIGAYVVAVWLAAIVVNLLLLGGHGDIALRDFGLCLAAFALGRLARTYDPAADPA